MTVINEDQAAGPSPWVDPDPSQLSVSIVVHDGPSSPKIYLKASTPEQLKQDLVAIFGNTEIEDVAGASVIDVVAAAHASARQIYQLNEILGATVDAKKPSQYESKGSSGWGNRGGSSQKPKEDNSVGKKEKAADPDQAVLDEIAGATSKDQVFKIFAKHSTGDLKTNGGWRSEAQASAAKALLAELAAAQ